MKNVLRILTLFCMILGLMTKSYADTMTIGDHTWTYTVVDEANVTINSVNPAVGEVDIPTKFDEINVTSIGDKAFLNCSQLTQITIPDSVTNIGAYAFYMCSSLKAIPIPSGVTSIGAYAFCGCMGLESITIPNDVPTSIGAYAFYECSNLKTITIENVTSIGAAAFSGCRKLESIIIPTTVTSIGPNVFYDCSSLETITIPSGVTSIGYEAFRGCIGLDTITIEEGVKSIGSYAFYKCSGLESITIPNSVASIGAGAFSGCSNSSSIVIPSDVTSIGAGAFSDCIGLDTITIPNGVTSIKPYTFQNCSELKTITIPNGVTNIGTEAFAGCSALISVFFEGNKPTIVTDDIYDRANADLKNYVNPISTGWESTFGNRVVVVVGVILSHQNGTLGFEKISPTLNEAMPTTNTDDTALQIPERVGYTFVGYFDATGKQYYSLAKEIVDGVEVIKYPYELSNIIDKDKTVVWDKAEKNVTLYAQWDGVYVTADETRIMWINGDEEAKIKPTVMKESVKAGTALSIDVANKLSFAYPDPEASANIIKTPLKFTIKSAELITENVGEISVASNKIKFVPTPFYFTEDYGKDAYAKNAVEFRYTIEVEVKGELCDYTFIGFVAVEPVNQAPRIVLAAPMFYEVNSADTITIENAVTIDAGVNETAQQTTVAFAETKGLENIKFEDNKLSFKNVDYLEIKKPTVVTINFTVTDTDEKEFGGANAKAMVSKGSIKVTLLPKVWNNAVPTFVIALDKNEPFNENAKAATYKIGGLITEISDGEAVPGKQKVTFKVNVSDADKTLFTKLPTIAVKGKTDKTGTGDLSFTLAANVNQAEIPLKITAHDNGLPIANSTEQTFTIKVKPTTPSVKSFKIVAKDEEENEISTGNVNEIAKLSATFDFTGRNVDVTKYSWTSGEKTGDNKDFTVSAFNLKAGDKVTLKIDFNDNAKQTGTWTGSFYLGNPEWSPAINLVEILKNADVTAEAEGTYQVSMTQGKIKNKVITSVNSEIPYIKVSEFIASKAKGFLPNAVVAITQIDKFDGKKFGFIHKETKDTPAAKKIEFITTNYADEAVSIIDSRFNAGIFTADIAFNDAQGFAYELFAGEEIKGKFTMKKIQNGTITFSDADLRSSNVPYTIKPSLFDYKFTHSFTLPKATANNVKMQIKVKPLNPLFTPKTFTNGTEEPVTFDTMPIAPVNFTNGGGIFPFAVAEESVVLGPVSDVKNAKYNVTFSWDSIQNADSYTVEYRLKDAAKWTKKNVKKLTSLVVPFSAGEYEWKITTTTKVEETLPNGKTKISAKTAEYPCGLFKVVTAADFKATVVVN